MPSILSTLAAGLGISSTVVGASSDPYAPQPTTCPSASLVRSANGLSQGESTYLSSRSPKAAQALKAWLSKVDSSYANATSMPTVALTHSGGGYRAFLGAAGVTQALDARDSNSSLAGLLQGLTYQGGLSGGSWFLSSMYGNNYPTVSSLENSLWIKAFEESLFITELFDKSAKDGVVSDVAAKHDAGFKTGLTDPWGRLLGYQFLQGDDGGVSNTMAGIANSPNFTSFDVPFPIITGTGVDTFGGACYPAPNATVYEFNPYEFGSWNPGVAAFTPMNTLGSNITNGKGSSCVTGFDNLGYVFGTSSSLFFTVLMESGLCSDNTTLSSSSSTSDSGLSTVIKVLEGIFEDALDSTDPDIFATYPNPFFGYQSSSHVSSSPVLSLVDGGASAQNIPIVPFLQPAREVDVLLLNDNSDNGGTDLPNGTAVYETYMQSQPGTLNLTRMPTIPEPATFLAQGLNTHPVAFGCNDTSKITLVYLPNHAYTYASDKSTLKLEYTPSETRGMIGNGNAVATRNNDKQWPACLACIMMKKKTQSLPAECGACFSEYCYN